MIIYYLIYWSGSSAGYAQGIPSGERTATAGERLNINIRILMKELLLILFGPVVQLVRTPVPTASGRSRSSNINIRDFDERTIIDLFGPVVQLVRTPVPTPREGRFDVGKGYGPVGFELVRTTPTLGERLRVNDPDFDERLLLILLVR